MTILSLRRDSYDRWQGHWSWNPVGGKNYITKISGQENNIIPEAIPQNSSPGRETNVCISMHVSIQTTGRRYILIQNRKTGHASGEKSPHVSRSLERGKDGNNWADEHEHSEGTSAPRGTRAPWSEESAVTFALKGRSQIHPTLMTHCK